MAVYSGRDVSRPQRLAWWSAKLGDIELTALTDDHIFQALEDLASRRGRYWVGRDADGKPIYKAKDKPIASAAKADASRRCLKFVCFLDRM